MRPPAQPTPKGAAVTDRYTIGAAGRGARGRLEARVTERTEPAARHGKRCERAARIAAP